MTTSSPSHRTMTTLVASTTPTTPNSQFTPYASPSDYALTHAANRCFHQWTTYPSPDSEPGERGRTRLKVSFATTSNFNDPGAHDMPTLFIHGPMVASRYFLAGYDHLARKMGVRVVLMDRPGFGLTPRSPPSTRLAHVLTATLAVLTHLHIRHTAFLSASAGSLYLLNTLSSPLLRPFLHPKRPYAAFLVPWVHPTYSKCGLLGAATKLPESWIGGFGDVQRWMVKRVGPVAGWSGGVVDAVGGWFGSDSEEGEGTGKEGKADYLKCFGVDKEHKEELGKVVMQYLFAEEFGVNDEAPFNLLKNMPSSYWGAAASYPNCIASIVAMEADHQRQSRAPSEHSSTTTTTTGTSHEPVASATADASTSAGTKAEAQIGNDGDKDNDKTPDARLHIHAFFAASDMLIGPGGKTYFDACFTDTNPAPTSTSIGEIGAGTSKPRIDQYVRYESETVPGTNHETIVELLKGVVGRVFEEVVEGW